jgi:hypothetical protein
MLDAEKGVANDPDRTNLATITAAGETASDMALGLLSVRLSSMYPPSFTETALTRRAVI